MARKINQAPSTQIQQFATDDIIYVARPSGLSDHWIKAQRISAIAPGVGDLQYFDGTDWIKTNGVLSFDGSVLTQGGVQVTVQDELVGGQAASATLQTPSAMEDGYVIRWDNTAGEFDLVPLLELISLDQLSDVDLTGAADNDLLYRSGGQWIDTAGKLQWDGDKLVMAPAAYTTSVIQQAMNGVDITGQGGTTTFDGLYINVLDTGRTSTGEANFIRLQNDGVNQFRITTDGRLGQSLIPTTANSFDLGQSTRPWGDLYLKSGGKIQWAVGITILRGAAAGIGDGISYAVPSGTHVFGQFLSLAEVTAPTTDTTGFGRLYANSADGLLYWRDDVGNVFDLTAGAVGDANEFQMNDGGGAFAATGIYQDATFGYGSIQLGNSSTSGNRRIYAESSTTDAGIIIQAQNSGAIQLGSSSSNGESPIVIGTTGTTPDPHVRIQTSSNAYALGIDNSDSDKIKLTYAASGNTPSTGTTFLSILPTGEFGIGPTSPLAKLHVDQSVSDAAIPVLILDQADDSEEMIEFIGTIAEGNAIEAVGAKSLTTTHFIKVTLPGSLTRYIPVGTIA